eukprot:6306-Pelagococcus_subviridis.AAC.3
MKGRLDIGKRIEGHIRRALPFAAADYLRVFPVIYPLQDTTSLGIKIKSDMSTNFSHVTLWKSTKISETARTEQEWM